MADSFKPRNLQAAKLSFGEMFIGEFPVLAALDLLSVKFHQRQAIQEIRADGYMLARIDGSHVLLCPEVHAELLKAVNTLSPKLWGSAYVPVDRVETYGGMRVVVRWFQ